MEFVKKHKTLFIYLSTFLLTLIMYMFGEANLVTGNEMIFSIVFYYMLFPLLSFVNGYMQNPEKILSLIIYPIYCFLMLITINNKWFGVIDMSLMKLSFLPAFLGGFIQMILWYNKNKTPKL